MLQKIKRQSSFVGAVIVSGIGSAHAAVPAAVTTAISDMQADALTVATAFLVATIAVVAFLFMKRGAK